MSEATTAFGTKYLPITAYEDVNGVMCPRGGTPSSSSSSSANKSTKAAKPTSSSTPSSDGDANPEQVALFMSAGIPEAKAKEYTKNKDFAKNLESVILAAGGPLDKNQGNLLFELAGKLGSTHWLVPHSAFLAKHIGGKKITNKDQLEAGCDYLKGSTDYKGFDAAAGIGVVVTAEEIKNEVTKVLTAKRAELHAKTNPGPLIGEVRKVLKFADAKLVKDEFDRQLKVLAPSLPASIDKPVAKKEEKKDDKKDTKSETSSQGGEVGVETFVGAAAHFHAPGHNDETDGYVVTPNTKRLLAEHVAQTGGRVVTRFPPEPNGILHIGHAKAINFNFSFANQRGGYTYLRYDDTNPEKEEEEFFIGIRRDVEWLGYTPFKITYASDNFGKLYECAIKLINKGLAYVCHMNSDDLKGFENRTHSPYRDRPIDENLKLFDDMKRGRIEEGKATLRLKYIMDDGKIDPVAYRIKFVPHERTKDEWCIYPTYDFTHPLCDSFENITHSLCTKEFQNHRSIYYWLCNALDVYCPVQWEYSRLNLSYTITSKRKIAKLIDEGIVTSWDDPRLFTISALRRRGIPAKALNAFCNKLGVTMSSTVISPALLDHCVLEVLNNEATRVMAALNPIKVTIANFDPTWGSVFNVLNIPQNKDAGSHHTPFSNVIYIDGSDFLENPDKDFRRLAPKQSAGLLHAGLIMECLDVIKQNGNVVELRVKCSPVTPSNKPKAFIQWVSAAHAVPFVARLYSPLFKHANPDDPTECPGGFLSDLNTDTMKEVSGFAEPLVASSQVGTVFQFVRIGYFCNDRDTAPGKLVFNLTLKSQ